MSKKVPVGCSRKRAGSKSSSAVAGAENVRTTGSASQRTDVATPSISSEWSWGHARRAGQQRRHRAADSEWSMIVELPETVPVLPAELAALEAHLGAAIAAILAGRH
jgi:hypothetical protein